ncbi:glycosyltransferase family 4 protein [Sporolactobacillus spathodeae]|uniref:Glycosyltransferase involved in cell wall biosynthesis n=1 Tax=Sporolactobacillus spathodeae TaxID=1465502 RepID=A0ABS2Q5J3_9BACL|nr:glycosyltransferase family 4 protein [Sporolactobacillus spathodeae]MBM7657052.1 glycosyltransferase involved in cell wall biosynthesis [Sporolactobacillus spathodeae]
MNVAIVTSGYQPVPAAKGGGVEALLDHLILKNEDYGKIHLTVFSTYHEAAVKMANPLKKTTFFFIKPPALIRICDKVIYFVAKHLLKKEKSMSYRYIAQRLHYLTKVSKNLQKNNYDKVILENHATLFLVLKKHDNAHKCAGRYYFHLHNEVTNDYGCRSIMLGCRKVLGVSQYINQTLKMFLGGLPADKFAILKNCADISRFGSSQSKREAAIMRQTYGIAPNEHVILFTGRLNKEKGIKELLLAFKKLNFPKTKLVIAGGYFYASGMVSAYEKELQKIAEPFKGRIIFTGYIAYPNMPAVYSMADVAVIPSMWNDPAPLTVIESMASGLPLITTVSGGIPEYACSEGAVLLARDKKIVDRLAATLNDVLSDAVLRQNMAEASRKTAERMNVDQYYKDFIAKISD